MSGTEKKSRHEQFKMLNHSNIWSQWLCNLLVWNSNIKPHLPWKVDHSFTQSQPAVKSALKIPPCSTTDVRPKNYKQQRRTPLLFLTGRSPEVIFPLPWNKSMKHNSLWTIAHLLKSDVRWGASHHRAYSVCWQRRPLINKPVLWNRCPSMSSVLRGNSENWLIRECLLFRMQPFGFCVSLPKSQRCFQYKQLCYLFSNQGKTKVWHGRLRILKSLSSEISCPLLSLW